MPRNLRIVSTSRPTSPGYFAPSDSASPEDGLMVFDTLLWRFAAQQSYWLATHSNTPHTMPVWGIWQDCAFRFSTHPDSRKAKNLRQTGTACVHLADPEAVFIMECHAQELSHPSELQAFVDDYNPKYKWDFTPDDVQQGTFALTPHTAYAWADGQGDRFASTGTRWSLEIEEQTPA